MLVSIFNRGSVQVLSLNGPADITETSMVDWWFRHANAETVVIDMRGVTFIDCAILGVFARWHHSLKEPDGAIVFCGARRSLRTVFSITNFDQAFDFTDTFEEAYDLLVKH